MSEDFPKFNRSARVNYNSKRSVEGRLNSEVHMNVDSAIINYEVNSTEFSCIQRIFSIECSILRRSERL